MKQNIQTIGFIFVFLFLNTFWNLTSVTIINKSIMRNSASLPENSSLLCKSGNTPPTQKL